MATKAEKKKEQIAAASHRAWIRAMERIFKVSVFHNNGTVTIPRFFVDRWKSEMGLRYDEKEDRDKVYDRAEADRIIDAIDIEEDL